MSTTTKKSLPDELRKVFWPIENFENKKFIPMAAMMFFILFNYSMLRSVKDSLIITEIGAEALGFLKTYVVLPSAIIALVIYAKLCNVMSQQKVFYTITWFFVGYLAFFTFVLFPNPYFAHPEEETILSLTTAYPNFKWFIKIASHWGISTFYAISELWGSMMLSLLFWQFANQITKTEEAKRFYSMFGLLGNFALPLSGTVLMEFSVTFAPILYISIINGIVVVLLYRWINKHVLTDSKLYNPEGDGKTAKKKKAKLSLVDSFKLIFSSKYLGMIAILVLSYGISVNLIEGVWKAKIKELYPTKEAYTAYMGQFQIFQGVGAIIFMLIGSNILRKLSWKTAALLTPLMMMITGLTFFGFILFGPELQPYIGLITAAQPLSLAVTIGMIQNVLSKATKYSLFDSTKEMAYIPLDDELKTKGKAAVDVVGGRFGKSGGGIIQSTFFILFPSLGFAEATPVFALICMFIIVCWLYGVVSLSKEYEKQKTGHQY